MEMYLSMLRAIKLYELEKRKLHSGIFIDISLHSSWSETEKDQSLFKMDLKFKWVWP